MAEKQVEATRVARVVKVGVKEHRMEVVFETVTEGGRSGQGRYLIDGVRVTPEDFDRVLRLVAV